MTCLLLVRIRILSAAFGVALQDVLAEICKGAGISIFSNIHIIEIKPMIIQVLPSGFAQSVAARELSGDSLLGSVATVSLLKQLERSFHKR